MTAELVEELRCQHAAWQARELEALEAFQTEQSAKRLAQLQSAGLQEELVVMRAAVLEGHAQAVQQAEATQAHAACLQQLLDMQEQHAQHMERCNTLEQQLFSSQRECKRLQEQLDNESKGLQEQVSKLHQQHQEEVASLNQSYTERLAHVESFKNAALASKRAAEELCNKERGNFEGTVARLEADVSRRAAAEEALKSRMLALRAELDATRRERDVLRSQSHMQSNAASMGHGAPAGMGTCFQNSSMVGGGTAPEGMFQGGLKPFGSVSGNGGTAGLLGSHQTGQMGATMSGASKPVLSMAGRQLGGSVRGRGGARNK